MKHLKRLLTLILILISFTAIPQNLYRSGIFLHHSTGGNIWGPNNSSTSIPQEMLNYNTINGYTGSQAVSMNQQWWPSGSNNEWEYWHRIFENNISGANIVPIIENNKIVVIKSCYPSSSIVSWGQPSDTLTPTLKTVYNYKWHWRHIINVMSQYPNTFFVIWTNAPLVPNATNINSALLSKKFTTWAKDTLTQESTFPRNVYVFNYFDKLTDDNGFKLLQYAVSNSDSHPNSLATELIDPQFVNEIFDAAISYENKILNINVLLEGLYNNNGTLYPAYNENGPNFGVDIADLITIELHNSFNYNIIEYSTNAELNLNGNASIQIPNTLNGSYYLTVKHRNSIETTSAQPVSFYNSSITYSFDLPSKAYGNNLKMMQTNYDIYSGDVNNDNYIEYIDVVSIYNKSGYSGYLQEDIDGNGFIEFPDWIIAYNNSINGIGSILPNTKQNQNTSYYGIYSGDVNQDGVVDTGDMTLVDNSASLFSNGYISEDINGDGIVDSQDMTIIDNNMNAFISAKTPEFIETSYYDNIKRTSNPKDIKLHIHGDNIIIDSENVINKIEIFNIKGQKIYTNNTKNTEISLSLKKGIYILRIFVGVDIINKKIII
jgi:hypothetical protein